MSEGPLFVLPIPDGTVGVFTLETVNAARARAVELGFVGPRAVSTNAIGTEPLLDSKQLGDLLGINDTTCEALAKSGRLPSIRIGRLLRFQASACLAALQVNGRLMR